MTVLSRKRLTAFFAVCIALSSAAHAAGSGQNQHRAASAVRATSDDSNSGAELPFERGYTLETLALWLVKIIEGDNPPEDRDTVASVIPVPDFPGTLPEGKLEVKKKTRVKTEKGVDPPTSGVLSTALEEVSLKIRFPSRYSSSEAITTASSDGAFRRSSSRAASRLEIRR